MTGRWAVRPLLDLAYLVSGLFAGVLTFTTTIVLLVLSVGLLPAFLLGIPVMALAVLVVHGLAAMERGRAAAFFDVEIPSRPLLPVRDAGWVRRTFARVRSAGFWKEAGYALLLLPIGTVSASLALAFWSGAAAGLTLPLYADRLPGDDAVTWLDWSDAVEVWTGFGAGLVLLSAAILLSAGLSRAQLALARSLLSPSSTEALRLQVSELRETRARVVDAADAERRRIERDLHDGTQQHLVALAMNLGRAKEKLDTDPDSARELVAQAHQEAKDSIAALREVVRGVHPAVLTDRGLDAALSALAARSPVPVSLDVDVAERPSMTVEAIAYFVVSEALTNVAKHSGASRASVHVEREGDRLLVAVSDDGHGGATESPNGGLAGLRDRVRAVDGTFRLHSSTTGTTVTVEVPCAS